MTITKSVEHRAISFEQDAITAINTITFKHKVIKDNLYIKITVWRDDKVVSSILLDPEEAAELKQFINNP